MKGVKTWLCCNTDCFRPTLMMDVRRAPIDTTERAQCPAGGFVISRCSYRLSKLHDKRLMGVSSFEFAFQTEVQASVLSAPSLSTERRHGGRVDYSP